MHVLFVCPGGTFEILLGRGVFRAVYNHYKRKNDDVQIDWLCDEDLLSFTKVVTDDLPVAQIKGLKVLKKRNGILYAPDWREYDWPVVFPGYNEYITTIPKTKIHSGLHYIKWMEKATGLPIQVHAEQFNVPILGGLMGVTCDLTGTGWDPLKQVEFKGRITSLGSSKSYLFPNSYDLRSDNLGNTIEAVKRCFMVIGNWGLVTFLAAVFKRPVLCCHVLTNPYVQGLYVFKGCWDMYRPPTGDIQAWIEGRGKLELPRIDKELREC